MNKQILTWVVIGGAVGAFYIWKARKEATTGPGTQTATAPGTASSPPLATGKLILGLIPKNGVSTDAVTIALQNLAKDGFGGRAVASSLDGSVTYTRQVGYVLVEAKWNATVAANKAQDLVNYVRTQLSSLSLAKPSVGFSSPTVAINPA